MVFFNYTTMEMSAKIVYYGPGLCGKTTNLQYIYNHIPGNRRGEMVSLPTETDRTLFFDLLPLRLGKIGGFTTRLQLYTVPGQVFYNSTRKLVLKGVDSMVFVADSQTPMLDANIESLENLQENLTELKLNLRKLPWIIQYNKRDLKNILSVEELNKHLNFMNVPYYEASAITGLGVIETLKGISKLTLKYLKRKAGSSKIERTSDYLSEPLTEEVEDEEEEDVHIGTDTELDSQPTVESTGKPEKETSNLAGRGRPEKSPTLVEEIRIKKPIHLQPTRPKEPAVIPEPKREPMTWTPSDRKVKIIKEVEKTVRIPMDVTVDEIPDEIHLKLNIQLDLTISKPAKPLESSQTSSSAQLEQQGWGKDR